MSTFFDELEAALRRAAEYNRNDQAAPVAVLWPDAEGAWQPLVPRLRERLPLLTLGPYDPESLTGPAIWLRCMLARTVPEAAELREGVPVVYLPKVSRAAIRAVEDCPTALQPLAEFQYRGVLWTQKNGKDWTLTAFLRTEDGGLRLPVAGDQATREALSRSLGELAKEEMESLRKRGTLNEAFFNSLLNPDPVRALLLWTCDPTGQKNAMSPEQWTSFVATCKSQYGFDPVRDGELRAAELIAEGKGPWVQVWSRFMDDPRRFASLRKLLERVEPRQLPLLVDAQDRWPGRNRQHEDELRNGLSQLKDRPPNEARSALRRLESQHAARREWVWAKLEEAPLAFAVEHLAALAEATEDSLAVATATEMAAKYASAGWKADGGLLNALACVRDPQDVAAVRSVCDALYEPWLRDVAESFQRLMSVQPPEPSPPVAQPDQPPAGTCFLFVDALRMDVAHHLCELLRGEGRDPQIGWRFASLPTVTATAKLGASPLAPICLAGKEFNAVNVSGTTIDAAAFRRLVGETGYSVFGEDETGDPTQAGWTETGRFDALGHAEGCELVHRIAGELDRLVRRIAALFEAGWREIRIVTDHGWLLLPRELSQHDLPEHLTEIRKGRCARLKAGALVDLPTVPWRWDSAVRIAVAPGITCFVKGKEYEHGGVSLQECVVPTITLVSSDAAADVSIERLVWTKLRCRVTLTGDHSGLRVDLRKRAADSASSAVDRKEPKAVDHEGVAALFVEDDRLEGTPVVLVVLDARGQVVKQIATLVGEE